VFVAHHPSSFKRFTAIDPQTNRKMECDVHFVFKDEWVMEFPWVKHVLGIQTKL
jgi:hypothetical protein